jgi:REP element-mobilizing transposase RayT
MEPVWHSRGYLPHVDGLSRQQFITFLLADSLPNAALERIKLELPNEDQGSERHARIEAFLDVGHGSCVLRDPACGTIVEHALLHFAGIRYGLIAWVVMPNHVHALIEPQPGYVLADIVHGWKSFTANKINRLLGRPGRLWQREYWDRYIRDMEHLQSTIAYIHANPVAAGLVGTAERWPFSSARRARPKA